MGGLARAASEPTRLGDWDFPADVAVGAGVLTGLALGRGIPPAVAVTLLLALAGGFVVMRIAALGMSLQAVAYATFLWHLWVERVSALWVPVVVAGAIGVLERRKLFRQEIPAFIRGWGQVLRLRRGAGYGMPGRGGDALERPG